MNIHSLWKCAVMIGGKRRYRTFEMWGDVEAAYLHTVLTYGIENFRAVWPIDK